MKTLIQESKRVDAAIEAAQDAISDIEHLILEASEKGWPQTCILELDADLTGNWWLLKLGLIDHHAYLQQPAYKKAWEAVIKKGLKPYIKIAWKQPSIQTDFHYSVPTICVDTLR